MSLQLQPTDTLQYLHQVDKSGECWQLQGSYDKPHVLGLWVDGYEDPLQITLLSDGTWHATLRFPSLGLSSGSFLALAILNTF